MHAPAILSNDLLTVYLNDHLGGATAGAALARRLSDENPDGELAEPLLRLAGEIADDRNVLVDTIERLHRDKDHVKVALGWTTERLSRLKPNGRVFGYSPLSRVLELETLEAGVEGKRALWRSLSALAAEYPELDAAVFEEREQSAIAQRELLAELHQKAVAAALQDGFRREA